MKDDHISVESSLHFGPDVATSVRERFAVWTRLTLRVRSLLICLALMAGTGFNGWARQTEVKSKLSVTPPGGSLNSGLDCSDSSLLHRDMQLDSRRIESKG
jgi:hypothetical protein